MCRLAHRTTRFIPYVPKMIYRLNCPKRLSKMEKANTSYHVVELPTTFKPHPTTSRTIKRELPDKSIKLWPMEQSIKTFEIGKDKVLLGPIKAEVVSRVMPKTFMKCHIFHVPPSIKVTKQEVFKNKGRHHLSTSSRIKLSQA